MLTLHHVLFSPGGVRNDHVSLVVETERYANRNVLDVERHKSALFLRMEFDSTLDVRRRGSITRYCGGFVSVLVGAAVRSIDSDVRAFEISQRRNCTDTTGIH